MRGIFVNVNDVVLDELKALRRAWSTANASSPTTRDTAQDRYRDQSDAATTAQHVGDLAGSQVYDLNYRRLGLPPIRRSMSG